MIKTFKILKNLFLTGQCTLMIAALTFQMKSRPQ